MDICHLYTSDISAGFPVFARICLSHLNSNHANIAIVPNGFHCCIIAELTNSYGLNESFFFLCAAERQSLVLQVPTESLEFITVYCTSALAMAGVLLSVHLSHSHELREFTQ